jgi:hypothetical protein
VLKQLQVTQRHPRAIVSPISVQGEPTLPVFLGIDNGFTAAVLPPFPAVYAATLEDCVAAWNDYAATKRPDPPHPR